MPQIKINFTLTQTTQLDPKAAINLFRLKLKGEEYKILEENDDSLRFYNSPWQLRWNFEPYIALDGGDVDIKTVDGIKLISFNYYVDFFPQVLFLSLLLVSTLTDRLYDGALFFACFYPVASIIAIIRAKVAAKRILREVLDEGVDE
jgi:hypothetical protein